MGSEDSSNQRRTCQKLRQYLLHVIYVEYAINRQKQCGGDNLGTLLGNGEAGENGKLLEKAGYRDGVSAKWIRSFSSWT